MIPMGQADAQAAMRAFRARAQRIVAISSGDVYLAYGRLIRLEPGPPEPIPLTEASPLRSVLYPYRAKAASPDALEHYYEKILVEREVLGDPALPGVVLRLPKVYGPGDNQDLATVRAFHDHPSWRWTHGYVENVAAAIALAATHPSASGIYNVGEEHTPTVAERLTRLPPADPPPAPPGHFNFDQHLVYDTSRIRSELAYREPVDEREGLRRTLAAR
jgi:nucleoside-diphosphate-sugar epimerase